MTGESLPPPSSATEPSSSPVSASPDLAARNVAAELVGTVVVMLLGPGLLVVSDGRVDDLAVAFGFGVGTALAIGVIGAVANPAFTLALLVVREITPRQALGDWVGQLGGGIVGGAMIWAIDGTERSSVAANGWDRGSYADLGAVMSAELIIGVVVVVTLLGAIGQGLSTPAIAAFTGVAVSAGTLFLLPLDGAGLNPARSIGAAIFADTDPSALGQLWVFVLMPLVAAVSAVFVWLAFAEADVDDTVFDDTVIDAAQNALTGDHD